MHLVEILERQWSALIETGYSPDATDDQVLALETFMRQSLGNQFQSVDYEGNILNKQDAVDSCTPPRLYVVNRLDTHKIVVRLYRGDTVAIVIGNDEIEATYAGRDVGGEFLWTDVWIKTENDTWICVAHHGSKLQPHFVVPARPAGVKARGQRILTAFETRTRAEDLVTA
jgi:hypothetical protein